MRFRFIVFSYLLTVSVFLNSQEKTTPEKHLNELMEGNERYVTDQLIHPNRSSDRREALTHNQNPFATIVGCSDSRVSPEIVFDQGIGDLFVVREAGNVLGPISLSSIKYSTMVLGSSVVFVLGHENCGAVRAVLDNNTKLIEPIAEKIQSAMRDKTKLADNPLEQAIKANVRAVVRQLRADKDLSKLIADKKLLIIGGYYHLGSGKVVFCCD